MWRLRPDVLLAAVWAAVTTVVVRIQLRRRGLRIGRPWAPRLPPPAGLGVQAFLIRLTPNCLERAVVGQAWLAVHGPAPDIVIGVPVSGMGQRPAHAWLEGQEPAAEADHIVIHRLPAARGRRG
jgi:hypothetical protein